MADFEADGCFRVQALGDESRPTITISFAGSSVDHLICSQVKSKIDQATQSVVHCWSTFAELHGKVLRGSSLSKKPRDEALRDAFRASSHLTKMLFNGTFAGADIAADHAPAFQNWALGSTGAISIANAGIFVPWNLLVTSDCSGIREEDISKERPIPLGLARAILYSTPASRKFPGPAVGETRGTPSTILFAIGDTIASNDPSLTRSAILGRVINSAGALGSIAHRRAFTLPGLAKEFPSDAASPFDLWFFAGHGRASVDGSIQLELDFGSLLGTEELERLARNGARFADSATAFLMSCRAGIHGDRYSIVDCAASMGVAVSIAPVSDVSLAASLELFNEFCKSVAPEGSTPSSALRSVQEQTLGRNFEEDMDAYYNALHHNLYASSLSLQRPFSRTAQVFP